VLDLLGEVVAGGSARIEPARQTHLEDPLGPHVKVGWVPALATQPGARAGYEEPLKSVRQRMRDLIVRAAAAGADRSLHPRRR